MNKIFIILCLVLITNEALGYRARRQADGQNNENDLEDRYGWERPNRPWSRPNRPWQQDPNPFPYPYPYPTPVPTARPSPTDTTTSTQSPAVQSCISSCPVTSEYNPVCGSNGVTYDNMSRLTCAQMCGESVALERSARCPATTQAPTAS